MSPELATASPPAAKTNLLRPVMCHMPAPRRMIIIYIHLDTFASIKDKIKDVLSALLVLMNLIYYQQQLLIH